MTLVTFAKDNCAIASSEFITKYLVAKYLKFTDKFLIVSDVL